MRTNTRWICLLAAGTAALAALTLARAGITSLAEPALAAATTSGPATTTAASRPAHWAQPMSRPGVPNFYKVSDTLYRGAQPTKEGMGELDRMGIKLVVNLRMSRTDRWDAAGTRFQRKWIWSNPLHPEDEDLVEFLKAVNDPANQPVFLHCRYGADRTGVQAAVYRMVVQGWSKEDAIAEMLDGGYGFHEHYYPNLVTYLKELDVTRIKKEAGL